MIDVTTALFRAISHIDNARLLAAHMPVGRVWSAAFDPNTNLGKLVMGLAVEYYRLGLLSEEISIEMDIRTASDLLVEWEKSVGLPNNCLLTTGSLSDRRRNIEAILSNFGGCQTAADFERIADFFGFTVTVTSGNYSGGFPIEFPVLLFGQIESKFTIVVTMPTGVTGANYFPLEFPLPFSIGGVTLLRCIFEALAPANCNVIFVS